MSPMGKHLAYNDACIWIDARAGFARFNTDPIWFPNIAQHIAIAM
jgi:hypothetical protein